MIYLIIYQIFQHGHLVLTKWSRLDLLGQDVEDLQMAYGLHSKKRLRIESKSVVPPNAGLEYKSFA